MLKWHKYPEEEPQDYKRVIAYNPNWKYNEEAEQGPLKELCKENLSHYQVGFYVDGMFYFSVLEAEMSDEDTLNIDFLTAEISKSDRADALPQYWTYFPTFSSTQTEK